MSTKDEIAFWAAVRTDFMPFLKQCFNTIYPGNEFQDNWHVDAIVHCLEESFNGRMPRLIINLPPRHLKSFIVSVAWPAYVMGKDPTAKIICVSYSDELAKTLARDFRRVVESDWYRRVFTNVKLTKCTETEAVTDQGGSRYATSVGGTLTGRGADFVIIDDPIKPEDAYSDKARNGVNDWYKSTLLSRLDDKRRSVLIIVMQRLHVNDLTGFAQAGGGFHRLSLCAIATKEEAILLRNGAVYRREPGEVLHCEREDAETLERIRADVGAHNFAAQYQQAPEAPEGTLFKRKWLQIVRQPPTIRSNGQLYLSVDAAASTSESADYSAITLAYVQGKDIAILQAERGRWDYEALKAKCLKFHRKMPSLHFVIEAASTGISLYKYLEQQRLRCYYYKPRQDKFARACLAVPILADQRVCIVDVEGGNQWVEPYIEELVTFPNGRFDDWVDSLVQLVIYADRVHAPRGELWTW